MMIPSSNLNTTISLILFLALAHFSGAFSQDQTGSVSDARDREDYKALIKQQLDSIGKTALHGDSPDNNSRIALYDTYKEQYLDLGSKGQWQAALAVALACESSFPNDLSPKTEVDLIYSIGYIYDKCANYLQALDYYHQSIEKYEAIQETGQMDLRNDIALTHNNIGVLHAHTGFFTQRKESYLKAREIWESIEGVDKSYLISIYGNLLRLYLQYGDKEAAGELITTINTNFDHWLAEESFSMGRKELEMAHPQPYYQVEKHRLNILYTDLISDKTGGVAHLESLHAEQLRGERGVAGRRGRG